MSYCFCGEYQHSVDAKGRMIIPQKFREILGTNFVVTRGLDGCLSVYPMEAWEVFTQKLKSLPISNSNARQFVRYFMAGAAELLFPLAQPVAAPWHLSRSIDLWAHNDDTSYRVL